MKKIVIIFRGFARMSTNVLMTMEAAARWQIQYSNRTLTSAVRPKTTIAKIWRVQPGDKFNIHGASKENLFSPKNSYKKYAAEWSFRYSDDSDNHNHVDECANGDNQWQCFRFVSTGRARSSVNVDLATVPLVVSIRLSSWPSYMCVTIIMIIIIIIIFISTTTTMLIDQISRWHTGRLPGC